MTRSISCRTSPPALNAAFLPQLVRPLPEDDVRHAAPSSRLHGVPRERLVPRPFFLWLTIAAALFSQPAFTQVARTLLPGFGGTRSPSRSVRSQGRMRLGWLPLLVLAHRLVRSLATRLVTPNAFDHDFRLLAIDGTTLAVPDTPANAKAFGSVRHPHRPCHCPRLRLVAWGELGTHALLHGVVKPWRVSEVPMARGLLRFIGEGDRLRHDGHFFRYRFGNTAIARGTHRLGRVPDGPLLTRRTRRSDGSSLARLDPSTKDRSADTNGMTVRGIEYRHHHPHRTRCGKRTRLVTTLRDAVRFPATELITLYHPRWEPELVYDEMKTHRNGRRVEFRSQTPVGVLQEVSGLMLAHGGVTIHDGRSG